jgi:hypothetical protein
MYAVHQIAKFSADPREPHGDAILYLVQYLKKSCDLEVCFQPDKEKEFECYCDSDFSGNWTASIADIDPSTSKLRSGWVVFYACCPIIWASKLQTQTSLSTTEAEYIAMSMALCNVISIMELIKEMKGHHIPVICSKPYVYCRCLKTTQMLWNLPGFPNFALAPSISMCATTIPASMSARDSSRFSQLEPLTRLLMY